MSDENKDKQLTISPTIGQVANVEGVVVKSNPLGESRKWIKLWVEPWLQGTTRYEMSAPQRAFWVDLLAAAGASRIAGIISPGRVNGNVLGYPLPWFQQLEPTIDVLATLELFRLTGKIAYQVTCENPKSIAVEILNWNKYQAPLDDATRARDYRERKKETQKKKTKTQ